MPSVSGGSSRGRGRGSNHATTKRNTTSRGTTRAQRGHPANATFRSSDDVRATFGNTERESTHASSNNSRADCSNIRNAATVGGLKMQGDWQERYQALRQYREKERKDAIEKGLMADPEKPRALADAITPVGTCQDMCPEYERVVRVVQKDVWDEEVDPNHSPFSRGEPEPDESRMVKKFRRSAAGNDEQLPSDLRPPLVLMRTCDYLFHDVIGNATSLGKVHHFVWDRTRAIRNDFSIQQLTKADDLRIAIECYERIARFHIVSLHLLAEPLKPYDKYDAQQEREQLDRTLVSLMQYYDDCRGRFESTNEAEFRAYTIIFQLRDPNPDLEDRVQSWPRAIIQNTRVQKALQIYAAACNTSDMQGPLKPGTSSVVARQDWERFWQIVFSNTISYLSACVAEIYFTTIRRMVLRAIFRASNRKSAAAKATNSTSGLDWSTDDLQPLFNFDDESDLIKFCEQFGFSFRERDEDGKLCLDLNSVAGRTLPDPSAGIPIQSKSAIVEGKRHRRTIPAVIDGLNVRQAQSAGFVVVEESDGMEEIVKNTDESTSQVSETPEDEDSLFMNEVKKPDAAVFTDVRNEPVITAPSAPPTSMFSSTPAFGKPSGPAQFPLTSTTDPSRKESAAMFAPSAENSKKPTFNFLGGQAVTRNTDQKPPASPFFNITSDLNTTPSLQPLEKGSFSSFTPSTNGSPFSFPSQPKLATQPAETPATNNSPFSFLSQLNPAAQPTKSTSPTVGFSQDRDAPTVGSNADHRHERPTGSVASATANAAGSQSPLVSNKIPESEDFVFAPQLQASLPSGSLKETATQQPIGILATSDHSVAPFHQQQQPENISNLTPTTSPIPNQSSLLPQESAFKSTQSSAPSQPAPSPPTNISPPAPTNGSGQGLRRQSMNDWKPKTPSKLSNSITLGEEGSRLYVPQLSETSAIAQLPTELFPAKQPGQIGPIKMQPALSSPADATQQTLGFDSLLDRLASELTFDPIAGFLKQYTDFTVSRVITEVQEAVYHERVSQEADDYRKFSLSCRYGKKWRTICRHNRLSRQGRARRRRVQLRSQQIEHGLVSEHASTVDDGSVHGGSKATSNSTRFQDRREQVDSMFQSTVGRDRLFNDAQIKASNKRSQVSGEQATHNHKRLKSTDAGDDNRSVCSAQSSRPDDGLLSRSSFLGFSLASDAPNRTCTTKTPYFRMKAFGFKSTVDNFTTRGLKRPRSESTGHPVSTGFLTSVALLERPSTAKSSENNTRPSSSSANMTSVVKDEDAALFARIQAARENLKEGTAFMRSEVDSNKKLRTSTSSHSSSDHPSMLHNRIEPRRKVEINATNGVDVPAYRLRQSRFLSRDHYTEAIQRSEDLRASRSQRGSRPVSALDHRSYKNFTTSTMMPNHRSLGEHPGRARFELDTSLNNVTNTQTTTTPGATRSSHQSETVIDTSTNPFAALTDHGGETDQIAQDDDPYNLDRESDPDEQYVEEDSKSHATSQRSYNEGLDHYHDDPDEPMDDFDGDIEDSVDEEGDEEDLESELEDDVSDGGGMSFNHIFRAPSKMPAFDDGPGTNADEPIELSD